MALDASIIFHLGLAQTYFQSARTEMPAHMATALADMALGLNWLTQGIRAALSTINQDIDALKAQAPHYGTLPKQMNRIPGQ